MTFAGFLLLIFNFGMAWYYAPNVTGPNAAPNWVYLVVAFNIWLYQTLDNIDGKQARRTRSSSPLGELFDHGCDSLFLLLNGMSWFMGMNITTWQAFLFLTQGTLAFYGSHWEEYHTHKLILGLVANPTEVQYAIMAVFVLMGLFGSAFWIVTMADSLPAPVLSLFQSIGVPECILSLPRNEFALHTVWIGIVLAIVFNGLEASRGAIRNGHSPFAPLRTIAPYALQVTLLTLWATWSKFDVVNNHPWMFLCMHGLLFSYLCVRHYPYFNILSSCFTFSLLK